MNLKDLAEALDRLGMEIVSAQRMCSRCNRPMRYICADCGTSGGKRPPRVGKKA